MNGLSLQLKYDYLKQASELIKDFEAAVLNYLETNDKQYLDIAYKKSYILHRTAKAVEFENLIHFFDQLEVLFSFLRNKSHNELNNAEFLLDLTDYVNNLHTVLISDIDARFNHHEVFRKINNFIALNNQKHIQAPEHAHYEKLNIQHAEIYDLSLELYSLKSSLTQEKPSMSLLQSLNYISEKLLSKTQELNMFRFKELVDKVKNKLPLYTHAKLQINAFGDDLRIEKKYLANLEQPLIDLFVFILRKNHDQAMTRLLYTVEESEVNTFVNFNFEKVFLNDSDIKTIQHQLKEHGLSFEFSQNSNSGLSFSLNLNKSFDLIYGYVFQVGNSQYIIEKEYIKETVELTNDSLFKLENHGLYYLSSGKNIPIITNGLFEQYAQGAKIGLLIEYKGQKAVMPIESYGKMQKVVKKYSYSVSFDKNTFKSLAFLNDGKPAFVFNGPKLIESAYENELKLTKYIECHMDNKTFAFRADQVKEIVSKELLSISRSDDGVYGLINYHGEIVPVFHPEYIKLNEENFSNILVFNCEGGHKGMLVNSNVSIKSILNDDIYEEHAFESSFLKNWICESYQKEGKEVNVLNPENIFLNQLFLKKVA